MKKSKRKKKRYNKNRTYQNKKTKTSLQSNKPKIFYSRLKSFWMKSNITFVISILSTFFTLITIIQWFFPNTSDAFATKSYEKGLIFLEDNEFQEAEKYFENAYKLNNNLPDLKYYYAYTEYILGKHDLSYKILKENRNSLNQNEMALYAMYEINKGNMVNGKKFLDKISNPENLELFPFIIYILSSTKYSFLNSYGDGVTTFWLNTILLDKKIEECHILPYVEDTVHIYVGVDADHSVIDETIIRIEQDQNTNLIELNKCKFFMFFLFNLYTEEYNMSPMQIYYLSEGAECFDYIYYKNLSMKYLDFILLITADELPMDIEIHKNLAETYEIILKKYEYYLSLEQKNSVKIIDESDRKTFEFCKEILNYYHDGYFDIEDLEIHENTGKNDNKFIKTWCEDALSKSGNYIENFR